MSKIDHTFYVHKFVPDNYELICSWWKKRNFPLHSFEHLPPTGFVVSYQGKAVAAGFLFKTDANIAVINSLVSNPDSPKEIRQSSVDFLVKYLTSKAGEEGFTMVVASTNIEKLGKRFEGFGLKPTDKNVTTYGRMI